MAENTYRGVTYITRQFQGVTQYSFDSGRTWRYSPEAAYAAACSYK